jgi:hypothetical protein
VIRQTLQEFDRAFHVTHRSVVGHAAGRAYARAVLFGGPLAFAEVQVRQDCGVTVVSEPPRDLPIGGVPPRHVMDHDDPGKRAGAERPCVVRVDALAVVTAQEHGFCELAFVGHFDPLPCSVS